MRSHYLIEQNGDHDGKKKNMAGMLDVMKKILNKKIKDTGQVESFSIVVLFG